ncbi:MAG: hypothetical protein FD166_2813 [Bacteroidetes bacterium]|nr:MAG: hypothetical protein FD166_2813 [Bacteroidota bacterium]
MCYCPTNRLKFPWLKLLFSSVIFIVSQHNYADTPDMSNLTDNPDRVVVSILLKGEKIDGNLNSVVIPLKQAGRLFMIEAKINEQEGNLIFDTGATELVLNRTYFRKYSSYEKQAGGGITGSMSKVYGTILKKIDVSGLFYNQVAADLADLGHIEDKRGVKILGLFGVKMIDNLEVIFDAAHSELRLNRVDEDGNRLDPDANNMQYEFTQKLDTRCNFMMIRGRINDKELYFCLDTGAEINVLSNNIPKKAMGTVLISRRSNLGGSKSGSVEALYGTMKQFEFGNYQFGSMGTVIIDLSSMCEAYGCSIDGMLGYDFWQKGVFCFNYRKKEISFNVVKGDLK